jgi:hypothetical protein
MRYYYILQKIAKVPAGAYTKRFAKDISLTNVTFTCNRSGAKKMRFIHAVIYSFVHGLSTIQCKHADEAINSCGRYNNFTGAKDYNSN